MKGNILITGFEPFNNDEINSSWEVIKSLPNNINGYKLNKLLLPVEFEESAKIVIKKVNEINTNYIICIGQAKGRKNITPEMVAANFKNTKINNNKISNENNDFIIPNGPKLYYSTLDVVKICNSINNIGIECTISYNAGTFVCNNLFYNLLHYYHNTNIKVGFIHIPILDEQVSNDEPSLDIDTMRRAIVEVFNTL